jgi:hypothetical protein
MAAPPLLRVLSLFLHPLLGLRFEQWRLDDHPHQGSTA